ncbi:MAG: aminopeptidase P family N-terminal domain-containing protein [Clostridia bacterium]|nr:aminopeptidase P family N-terminal domain-containing protein [Clostridia bacterium]
MDKLFDELKVDGVLVTSPYNMRYVSGFSGGEGAILITPSKKYIFVDGRYTIQAKQQAKDFTVVEFKKGLFYELEKFDFETLGIEDDFVTFSFYKKLKEVHKNCEFIGISHYLEIKRSVKTDDEISYIKKAEEIGDKAFSYVLGLIKEVVN